MWQVHSDSVGARLGQETDVHVVPLGDFREHQVTRICWCRPVEDEDTPGLYIHKAMDGREAFERGERKPS